MGYYPIFTVVSTYGISNIKNIKKAARKFHIHANPIRVQYKIEDGIYQFRIAGQGFGDRLDDFINN